MSLELVVTVAVIAVILLVVHWTGRRVDDTAKQVNEEWWND